jgi:cytochrome c oxidase subunit 2
MNLFRQLACVPEAASTVADDVDRLHAFVLLTTLAGTFVVFAATTWMVARFHGPVAGGTTTHVRLPIWLDVVVIAGLLSLFLGWWVMGFRLYIRMRTPPDGAMPIYVTAKQWMWEFTYPDGTRAQDVLVVPEGQPIRLALSSRDVIHSFFVPAFRIKQDAVPGQTTIAWFQAVETGEFPILCAEYCGLSHSGMRGKVRVLDAAEWGRWAESNRAAGEVAGPGALAGLAADGRTVAAEKGCLACHSIDGSTHIGPTWRGLWYAERPLADGTTVRADEAYLTRSMMEPEAQVVAGFGAVMPSFRGRLDARETAALLEYIRWLEPP